MKTGRGMDLAYCIGISGIGLKVRGKTINIMGKEFIIGKMETGRKGGTKMMNGMATFFLGMEMEEWSNEHTKMEGGYARWKSHEICGASLGTKIRVSKE